MEGASEGVNKEMKESQAQDKSTVLTKVAAQNNAFYLGENDALRPYRSASGRS